MVTEEMREAGSQIASDLMDAQVSFHMGGLGGSKEWEEFESFHCGKNMDMIKQYVNGEIDSVTAIYIAMHRESITPNPSGMKLTVILRDDSPMIHCGDTPAYRSVQVNLTPEQVAAIAPRKTGSSGGQVLYESISKAFIEPNKQNIGKKRK